MDLKDLRLLLLVAFAMNACGKVASVSEQASPLGTIRAVGLVEAELAPVPVETDYKEIIKTENGQPPFKFELLGGELPAGLNMEESSGIISGKVARSEVNKNSSITVKVSDAFGTSAQRNFNMVVNEYTFAIAPEVLPEVTPGAPFSMAIGAVGASAPLKFSVSGTLPPGMTLAETGVLSTGPEGISQSQENTKWNFQVLCTDANGVIATREYEMALGEFVGRAELTIVSENIPAPAAGTAYSAGIAVSGGKAPYQFDVKLGDLPDGIAIDKPTGMLSGTVAFAASGALYDFTIEVTDAIGVKRERRYQGAVTAGNAALVIHTASLANPTAGQGYSAAVAVTGGSLPYTFAIDSGSLPTGLALSTTTGAITGTVDYSEGGQNFFFVVRVTDSVSTTATKTYSGTVASGISSLTIPTVTLPNPLAGNNYSTVVVATGGKTPYTYVIQSGGIVPSGLSIDSSNGVITGSVPLSAANQPFAFTVQVTDDVGQTQSRTYNGTVTPYAITVYPTSLGAGDPSRAYSVQLATVGGQTAYTYTLTAGTLPSGLSLTTGGLLSGTIAEAEAGLTKNFTVGVSDGLGTTTSRNYSITTAGFAVSITTASLATAFEGTAYSETLAATGGTGPYTYEYTGTMPTGIGLQNNGSFFGTPASGQGTTTGTNYNISFRAKDAAGRYSVSTALTLTVDLTAPAITASTLPAAVLGTAYSQTLASTGGRGPYTYAMDSGSLPVGLSLSAAGVISGTPTATASCPALTFSVRATDSSTPGSQQDTQGFCIAAVNGLVLNDTALTTIVRGSVYSAFLSVAGGTGPYTYTSSNLPSGLALNSSTGELAGSTSVAAGNVTVYVTVSDTSGLVSTRPVILTITDPLSFGAVTFAKGGTGKTYGPVSVNATGGVAPYTFTMASGTLPTGLTMSSAGAISGTLDAASAVNSPYTFTVRVDDSSGLNTISGTYTIYVTTTPKILTSRLESTTSAAPFIRSLEFTGGIAPFTFTQTGLPAGLTLDAASGFITGSTTAVGSHSIDFTITDVNGIASTKTVALTVFATGKTMDFQAQKFVEPCPQTTTYNCDPRAYKIAKLVTAQTTTNYMVYSANLSPGTLGAPVPRIYVARIDTKGRIQTPAAANVLNVAFTPNGFVTSIEIADIDLDGNLDIIYGDYTNNRITVMWNSGTTDANGMPTFPTSNNFAGAAFANKPQYIKAAKMRNGANANTWDLMVLDWRHDTPAVSARVIAVNGTCTASCVGSRATALTAGTAYPLVLTNTRPLIYAPILDVGNFHSTICKDVVIVGRQDNANNDYMFIKKQDITTGTCQGTYTASSELLLSGGNFLPQGLAVADYNNDGYDDAANTFSNNASARVVIMGAGGTGFTGSTVYAPTLPNVAAEMVPYCLNGATSCTYPSIAVVGGRALPYLFVQGQSATGFISFLPNTSGTFENGTGAQRIDYIAPTGIGQDLIAMPITSSGKNDLIYMGYENNGLPYYFLFENNNGNTSYPLQQATYLKSLPDDFANAAEVGAMAIADINGDSSPDLVSHLVNQQAIATHAGPLGVSYGISPQFFSAGVQHGFPVNPAHQQQGMVAGDFDADGDVDVSVIGAISRALAVMLNDGTGTFSPPALYSTGDGDTRPYGVAAGDMNNDGMMDLVSINVNAVTAVPSIAFHQGNGDGTFKVFSNMVTGATVGCNDPRSIVLFDMDRDGKQEILITCYTSAQLVVFRRHTDGSWKKNNGTLTITGANGSGIALAHLTPSDACYSSGGDFVGRPCIDVIIPQLVVNGTVRVISNLTMGTPAANGSFNVNFTANNAINMFGYGWDAVVGDFDQDGVSDYAVSMASQNSSTSYPNAQVFNICKGNGTGGCASIEGWGMDMPIIMGLRAGDINNDGLTDLVGSSRTGQRLPYMMIGRYLNTSN